MLSVNAVFLSATGALSLSLTGDAEAATISAQNGNIVVANAAPIAVDIYDNQGQVTSVNISEVKSLGITGDAALDQSVQINVALAPTDGLSIDSSIETAIINQDVRRVTDGDVNLNAQRTLLAARIEAPGFNIHVGGDLVLSGDVALEAADVTFTGRIDDDGNGTTGSVLTIEANGMTQFGGEVGGLAAIDRLVTDAAGQTRINADISASGGTLIFNDPVVLTSSVALSDTGPTGINFNSTVDSIAGGHRSLELTATAGRITFNGNVGDGSTGDQSLGSLTVTEAAGGVVFGDQSAIAHVRTSGPVVLGSVVNIGGVGVVFNGNGGGLTTAPLLTISTGGDSFRLNGKGVLQSNLLVNTDGGNFLATADAPIDSGVNVTRSLTISAGAGAVMFNEDLGRQTPLGGLTVVSADGGIVFGQADIETPGSGGLGPVELGPVELIATTGPIELGTGTNVLAGGIIFNAGAGKPFDIKTTGDQVRINGRVTLESHLQIDTGTNGGDVLFTVDSPIASRAGEANDLTLIAGKGGVFFNADLGRAEPIGRLRILRADAGVTFGQADSKTADGGQGPVTLIRAIDTIDLGVGGTEITGPGITLNAGSGVLAIETAGKDLRANGRLTLASGVSITTGSGAGDIVFTNDTPVDSADGEMNDLSLHADLGAVRFNEDLGATNILGSLTVVRADGGVLFGESITEIPGSGSQGPVDRVRVKELIDVGVGANVIQGDGIVLTGGAVNGLHISTVDRDIRFNGSVTLGNAVRLETGSGWGDINFTRDALIDSAVGRTSDLFLNAGAGRVSFNQDIGSTVPLGGLVIERADAGVQFGGASTGVPNTGDLGPVEIVYARRGINVGVGLNVIGGNGIDVNGGMASSGAAALIAFHTDNRDIRLNGELDLQSSARFDTSDGSGDVIFTNGTPIDSSDGPESAAITERNSLVVDAGAGQVVFNANLGASQRLDELTIERAAGGVVFGGADVATAGGTGPVTSISTDGSIDIGAGNALHNVITKGIILNGGSAPLVVTTSDDLVRLNGPVTATSMLTINTTGGGLLLTAVASLNSQANHINDVVVNLGTGDGTFAATIGDATPLGELQIVTAHDMTFAQAVFADRVSQLAGSGTTTFKGAINTTDLTRAGVELTGTDVAFHAPITATGDGRVIVNQSGLLDINENANMRLDGAFRQTGGAVETAAEIVTSGDAIAFGGAVTLTDGIAANVRLDTTAGGNLAGARVSFANQLDGETDASETIHINAGTAHDVVFAATVGNGVRVGTVNVIQARDVTFGDAVVVGNILQTAGQGTTTFAGAIDANSSLEKAVDLATVNVTFADAITTQGDGRVEVTISGLLDIGIAADMTLNGAFWQDGGGMTLTSADIVTSDADVQFADAVIIREDVSIETGAGSGTIAFLSSLNGLIESGKECGQHPTLSSGSGDMTFAGPVGNITAFGDILILSANDLTFHDALRANSFTQQSSSGETRFESVVIKGATGLDAIAGAVRFDGDVDTTAGNGPIRVVTADDITVNATLRSGNGTVTLSADNNVTMTAAGTILADAIVTITADANNTGGSLSMVDGATVRAGAAAIHLLAGDDVRLGSLITTDLVTVTSHNGSIVDGGDVDGFDITADRVALRARQGIGTDNPIDIRVKVVSAENLAEGGIRFNNRIDGRLTIGTVDGLTGIMTGPGTPADLGGDIEISNVGTIDVDATIRNDAGGHTMVRAENPGNLNVNQPIQNRGGDGWIFLFAGEDLIINDSLPEFVGGDPKQPFPQAEVSVHNEGAIRGQARGKVIVDNSETDYVVIRTHAERFPDAASLPTLPDKFLDPADFPEDDPAFFAELDAALAAQREAVSAQITNVAPVFEIESVDQGGANLDERARGILKITIGNGWHLERNFHVTVDWGDGNIENYTIPGNPRASDDFILSDGTRNNFFPDATITASFDSGELLSDGTRMPGVYFIHHTYIQPPDLADPSAPIPVLAEIRYDARPEGETSLDIIQPADGSEIFNGIRFFENITQEIISVDSDVMTNPGQGAFAFIKVIESEIIPVKFRKVTTAVVNANTVTVTSAFGEQFDFATSQFETQTFGDYRLFFTVFDDVSKREFGDFSLPVERIANPITVFTKDYHFPNGQYRVYLEDLRTKRTRIILEVHIYEGRVVPPNFRQGATERQPGSDAVEDVGIGEQPSPEDGATRKPRHDAAESEVANSFKTDVGWLGSTGTQAQLGSVSPQIAAFRGFADPRYHRPAENSLSATTTSDDNQSQTTSAVAGGAAAWLVLKPRLRSRLKKPDSNDRRLDKAARITRRLRDKIAF